MSNNIGRNDPCHCGSGKKYKRCHGAVAPMPSHGVNVKRAKPREKTQKFFERTDLRPGCYDDPEFLALEQSDSTVLEDYAKYVLTRPRSAEEDERTQRLVPGFAARIVQALTPAESQRQCVSVSNALIRMLERVGVWCFGVTGSVRFVFPSTAKVRVSYSRVIDKADFPGAFLGHAWIVAPPFAIVDCTAKTQSWPHGEDAYIPAPILVENAVPQPFDDDLWCADKHRPFVAPPSSAYRELWTWLPTRSVTLRTVELTLQPHGVNAPDTILDKIDKIKIGGLTPLDFLQSRCADLI